MDIQVAAIILLSALVIALIGILIRNSRRGSSAALPPAFEPDRYMSLLSDNAARGEIQAVASTVSDLLKGPLGCERIVFLRKQRAFLELNYYHGIRRFQRSEFRVRHTSELTEFLRQRYQPRPLAEIESHVPTRVYERLKRDGFDRFFPVFWRTNLYGLYFVQCRSESDETVLSLLLASLAQTLSAAYHVKWHETRFERLSRKLDAMQSAPGSAGRTVEPSRSPLGILKLVRHRTPATLVPKLIDSIRSELNLNRVAYIYEPKEKNEPLRHYNPSGGKGPAVPSREVFDRAVAGLSGSGVREVSRLAQLDDSLADWAQSLKREGIDFLAAFPISSGRSGVLLLDGNLKPESIAQHMEQLVPTALELVQNAESYEKVQALSFTDNLTGLANQRYFTKRLQEEINRAHRYQRSLALIIFDLDDLKGINDQFGHLSGDQVLRRLGQMLRNSIRAIDIVARYGGDEFCVIMPEADQATAQRFMARLREKIASSRFHLHEDSRVIACTISQGAAVFPDHATDQKGLIYAADMALLTAKEAGRNSFLVYEEGMTVK